MSEGVQSWEVLNTKVEFQGQQIEKLADETARQFVDFRDETGKQLTSLRQDFKGEFGAVRNTLDSLTTTLANSSSEREKNSRGSWIAFVGTGLSAIGISATLLGTLATLRLTPIENDVKNLKDSQSSTVAALAKITDKLDNFETRAELTERNARVDAALNGKADAIALDYAIKDRVAVTNRIAEDVAEIKAVNTQHQKDIVELKVTAAELKVLRDERTKELARMSDEMGKLPARAELDGLKFRLEDQRDRLNILSNRQQFLFERNYATPRQPCLDTGAGCGPTAPTGPVAQPGVGGK